MAYDDKDLKALFPTANSGDVGAHEQRTAIDHLGGANQIRTSIRIEESDTCKVTTRLRTRGGFPDFIVEKECSDTKEKKPVYMDSGVVDLLSIAPGNPLTALSCPLYYGSVQQGYFANGKLLGKIVPPSIAAPAPPANATPGLSFTAARGDLVGKKEAAAKCPASMFTGKARLYAQALYGGDLRNWKWALNIPDGLSPRLVHDNGTVLHMNCGVYRDEKYLHWLIAIHPDGIRITKLVRDKRVDMLVGLLGNPAMAADHDKIEAYILAYSNPSDTMTFTLDVHVPETQMLGYGWKFNWRGDKADIIRHIEGSPLHESTHYRVTFSRDTALVVGNTPEQEAVRWSAVISVVSGPHYWHNSKYAQVISGPNWLFNVQSLFGTRYGGASAADVPVYCFYKSDGSLEVFKYYASGGEGETKYMVASEPASWMRPVDWTSENLGDYTPFGTSGLSGGDGERRVRSYRPITTGFHCSDLSSVDASQSYTFIRYSIGAKTYISEGAVWSTNNVGHTAYEHTCAAYDSGWSPYYVTADGVQRYTSGTVIVNDLGSALGYASGSWNNMAVVGYDRYQYVGGHEENHNTLLLVPFHDAEAVYLWGNMNVAERATVTGGYCESTIQPGFFVWKETEYFLIDGVYSYYTYLAYAGGDGTHLASNGSPQPDLDTSYDRVIVSKLVTKSSNVDFSPPSSLGAFFSGEDFVEQQFYTHSAAVGSAAYGHGAYNLEGFPAAFVSLSPPPFIGWA